MDRIICFSGRSGGVLFAVLLGAAVLLQAGCDALMEQVGVDEVDINTSSFASDIPVASVGAQAVSGSVSRGGVDLPGVFDVASITLEQEDVSYSPLSGSGKMGEAQDTGTIDVLLIVDQYPAVTGRLSIENDVVTAITPATLAVGAYDEEAVLALLDALEEAERPALASDWQDLSQAEIIDKVNTALRSASFDAAIVVQGDGDLAGTLSITEMTFELDF